MLLLLDGLIFNCPLSVPSDDFSLPNGESFSWWNVPFIHAMAIHENAILGIKITHN